MESQNNRQRIITISLLVLLVIGVVGAVWYFSLLQAGPLVTQQPEQQPQSTAEIEEVGPIDLAVTRDAQKIVNVSGGQAIEFKNSGAESIPMTINFQEPITEQVDPGGNYVFRYPDGYSELKFSWLQGEVTFKRRG